jgi:hypothetical protein
MRISDKHLWSFLFAVSCVWFFGELIYIGLLMKNSQFDKAPITSPFAIHAGEENSVPEEIIAMKRLAAEFHIETFSLSQSLLQNNYITQRAIETLYPTRFFLDSKMKFALRNEDYPEGCNQLWIDGDVALVECKG